MSVRLQDLQHCFQGVAPAVIGTCSADGEPNVTYLSQVFYVDPEHVALSCQFFNKTRRNVEQNPYASITLYDPITFDAWKMQVRYLRSETSGPVFDTMAARIQVIASHTGMAGVFRLIAADHYRVLSLRRCEGYLAPPDPVLDARVVPDVPGPLTELRGLQFVSDRVARATDLDDMLGGVLLTLDEVLGFAHSMVLIQEPATGNLLAIRSRGYGESGVGAEVAPGCGLIGTVAERRRMVRLAGMGGELRYGRAIRDRLREHAPDAELRPEVPLPGLQDAQAQLGLPLLVGDRLLGVLAFESRDPLCFDEWDEAYLQIVANQIAMGIDRLQDLADRSEGPAVLAPTAPPPAATPRVTRRLVYYRSDDCVFCDGEFLVRNLPGRILWKLLRGLQAGRSDWTNRELRLDDSLGLPAVKDNLESRLILLRKRLQERCPDIRMVSTGRGRFTLHADCALELAEA